MKIVAIPVVDGKLSAHFGHCQEFHFFTLVDGEESLKIKDVEVKMPPAHEIGVIPKWVSEEGATDIIVGGIGEKAIDIFNENDVDVHVGAAIISVEELINNFLEGTLEVDVNLCDH
ncbi:MAG: NifB/NifX family molybdenum-iron cluster-binding protein [Bacteroidota bacterium]|nr:NifB/NifX family molybdenum-iron cluster-binding protein [Bacteroidota bacterium]